MKGHRDRGYCSQSGFTLFELLIVLFIIALTSSVVFFSAGRLHEKTVFHEETRRLVQTIKQARQISLLEKKTVEVTIDEEAGNYRLQRGDENVSAGHTVPEGYTITGDSLLFFPKGNSSGGTLMITDGKGREYEIKVDPVVGTPTVTRF